MTLVSTQIADLIQSVGFPIFAFLLMWTFASKTQKENTEAIKNLTIAIEGLKR